MYPSTVSHRTCFFAHMIYNSIRRVIRTESAISGCLMDVDAVIIITNEKETSARKHSKNKHSYYEDFLTNFAHHTRYGKYI